MNNRDVSFFLFVGFGMGGALASCAQTESGPDHCWARSGDATCFELYGNGARPYCSNTACDGDSERFHGCVAERPVDECYSRCGDGKSVLENNACDSAGDYGDDESTDTGAEMNGDGDTDTASPPCTQDDCTDPAAPFCDGTGTGVCVSCDDVDPDPDAACALLNPQASICVGGLCMECAEGKAEACADAKPVCDLGLNMCVKCTEHGQCPDSACNLALGNCMDPDAVVHLDGDGGQDFENFAALFAANPGANELTIILHEKSEQPVAYAGIEIKKNDYVAILAAPDESPVVTGSGENPALAVTTGSTLFLRGVTASNTPEGGVGLYVGVAAAWVQECLIVDNSGGGILLANNSSTLVLDNSFVGGDVNHAVALDVGKGAAQVVYSTLAGGLVNAPALACSAGRTPNLRNSLIVARQAEPEVQCPDAVLVDNALEMAVEGNVSLGVMPDMSWFEDYADGNLHLAPGMYPIELESAATWTPGDPSTDIDGQPRPIGPDFAGADRIP